MKDKKKNKTNKNKLIKIKGMQKKNIYFKN